MRGTPHSDPEVLHAPGECASCDQTGKLRQVARLATGTPFTPVKEELAQVVSLKQWAKAHGRRR